MVFHSLKNYGAYHIFKLFSKNIAAKYDKKGKASYRIMKIIALNLERYTSFEILYLRFIDSYQFLNANLEKLVSNLPKDSYRHTRKHLGDDELLFPKGISRMNGLICSRNLIVPNARPKTRYIANWTRGYHRRRIRACSKRMDCYGMPNIQKLSRSLFENVQPPSIRRVREFHKRFNLQLPPGSGPPFDYALANVGRLFRV
jgi:hypothetical protein